jgi:hypothetical protein
LTRQLPKAARFQLIRKYLAALPAGMPTSGAYLAAGAAVVVPLLTAGVVLPSFGHGMLERDPGAVEGQALGAASNERVVDFPAHLPQPTPPPAAPGPVSEGPGDPRNSVGTPTPSVGSPRESEPADARPGATGRDGDDQTGDRDSEDESPREDSWDDEAASSRWPAQATTEPSERPSASDRRDHDRAGERDGECVEPVPSARPTCDPD